MKTISYKAKYYSGYVTVKLNDQQKIAKAWLYKTGKNDARVKVVWHDAVTCTKYAKLKCGDYIIMKQKNHKCNGDFLIYDSDDVLIVHIIFQDGNPIKTIMEHHDYDVEMVY